MTDITTIEDIFPFPPEGYELPIDGTFRTSGYACVDYEVENEGTEDACVRLYVERDLIWARSDLKELRKFLKVLEAALPK